MRLELTEVQWSNAQQELPLDELLQLSGLPETELRHLVDFGVLTPLDPHAAAWSFATDCLPLARAAGRLMRDFDLDSPGLAVALTLIERVHELEARLRNLHAQLSQDFSSI